jgi:hypothetical protein
MDPDPYSTDNDRDEDFDPLYREEVNDAGSDVSTDMEDN